MWCYLTNCTTTSAKAIAEIHEARIASSVCTAAHCLDFVPELLDMTTDGTAARAG
jgi:hypothetical protein